MHAKTESWPPHLHLPIEECRTATGSTTTPSLTAIAGHTHHARLQLLLNTRPRYGILFLSLGLSLSLSYLHPETLILEKKGKP